MEKHGKVLGSLSGVFTLALSFLIAAACQRVDKPVGDVTVIEGGTLLDGTGRAPIPNAVIVIEGNVIKAVGAKGSVEVPAGARKVNASDKWVLPGLIEAHGHYREYVPELLINHGITTEIDTGNYMDRVLAAREAVASGKLRGPRIFTTGSGITGAGGRPFRDRMVVHNAAEARAAAEEHIRRKVDFIKVYSEITAEELAGVTEVAHKAGLVVVGHLMLTDAREAAMAGIDGLVHGTGISAALVPEREAKLHKRPRSPDNPWGMAGTAVWHPLMNESKFDDLIQLLVARHVMIEPDIVHSLKGTLKRWDRFELENRRLLVNNPNIPYLPRERVERWLSTGLEGATPELIEQRRIGYEKLTRFLKKFVAAGGVLLAGSDFVGSAAPGTTLHQELEVFVEDLGLTPMQAIQTATRNTAEFYLKGKGLGTLEPGKQADLIVLRSDPLKDIRNTRSIELVMKEGRLMELGYHADYTNPYIVPEANPVER